MPTQSTSEIDRLRRENRRLKGLVAAGGAVALLGTSMGMSGASEKAKPVGITTDGTYLYRLLDSGRIERIQIEARTEANQEYPQRYYARSPEQWNLFTDR